MNAHHFGLGTVSLVAVLSVFRYSPVSAAVIANFTDGNDNTATVNPGVNAPTADSYKGLANAGGWTSAWSQTTTGTINANGTQVINTTPLAGGGNYLQVDQTGAASGASVHNVRSYANAAGGGIDTTLTHSVSFNFRLDSAVAGRSLTDTNDFIRFFDNTTAAGTGSTATAWQIYAGGVSGQTGGVHFRLNSGDGGGAGGTVLTDTGILLANNAVYSVEVTIHPVAGTFNVATNYPTWDTTISDGTNTFTQTGLRFRNNAITSGRILQFGGSSNGVNEVLQYSLDNVSVAVPEPGSLAVLGLGAGLLMRRRR